MHFLILSTAQQKHLAEAITEAGHTYELAAPSEFQMYLSDKPAGYDAIYRGSKPVTRKTFDCVIPRLGTDRAFGARLLRHFRENLGVFTLQTGRAVDICSDKWETSQILSAAKIKVPKQFFCNQIDDLEFIAGKLGGFPIIAKPTAGSQGKGVMKLTDEETAGGVLEYLHQTKQNFILQQYLNTSSDSHGGVDTCYIVVGNEVVSAMQRTAPKGRLRANLSIDATGEPYTPTPQQEEMAIKAVQAIDGLNFAGVDIMTVPDPDGDSDFLVEINSNCGSKIIGVTENNHFKNVVTFCANIAPNYSRAFDMANEKRVLLTLPEEIRPVDLADAYYRLLSIGTSQMNEADKLAEVKAYANSLGSHGSEIVSRAQDILREMYTEHRGWTYKN